MAVETRPKMSADLGKGPPGIRSSCAKALGWDWAGSIWRSKEVIQEERERG